MAIDAADFVAWAKLGSLYLTLNSLPEAETSLRRAVKIRPDYTPALALAKEILVRNGFTAKDLENAKISLRTGGGKGGEDKIEISVTCCDPKEITIQRTLENFTKTNH